MSKMPLSTFPLYACPAPGKNSAQKNAAAGEAPPAVTFAADGAGADEGCRAVVTRNGVEGAADRG